MAVYRDPDETDPSIDLPKYSFRITQDERWITIRTRDGKEKPYRIDVLLHMLKNDGGFYPEPAVDMARKALSHFGKLPKTKEEEELSSSTITTIAGIKIYQSLTGLRRFFAWVRGRKIYGTLTDLEKRIKGKEIA